MLGFVRDVAAPWRRRSDRLFQAVFGLVVPPVCAYCRRPGALICPTCREQFREMEEPLCQRCGQAVGRGTTVCRQCRHHPTSLAQSRAAFQYVDPLAHLIHQLKYNNMFALARPLAQLMAGRWPAWQQPVDALIPIPLHPARKRERGYNQAALLAQHLGEAVGLPVVDHALVRIRQTRPQVTLNREERQLNMIDAFQATEAQVWGRHVLLIDDVYTTGATLAAAANALRAAGAASVSGFTLARAQDSDRPLHREATGAVAPHEG